MPRSSEDLREIGKQYYGAKQYGKAIEAFTQALEARSPPDISLYDYRAATWEKLDKLEEALRDARQMIRLQRREVRGYLRTGKILQKLQKPDVALGIYQYGIRNVPASSENYDLLQKMHDKLTRQLSPPKSVDPFVVLPVELIEMIISYLSFCDAV